MRIASDTPIKTDTTRRFRRTAWPAATFIQLQRQRTPRLMADDKDDIPVVATEPSALQNLADTTKLAHDALMRFDEGIRGSPVRWPTSSACWSRSPAQKQGSRRAHRRHGQASS